MNRVLTLQELLSIVSRVEYLDWGFYVSFERDVPYVQVQFYALDMVTKETVRQYCRKWMLSYTMTETEIVSTCWNAVKAAVEHEARENFKYSPHKGKRARPVFQPHLDVAEIYELASHKEGLDMKEGEVTGEWVKPDLG